jgi:hypothetical protein
MDRSLGGGTPMKTDPKIKDAENQLGRKLTPEEERGIEKGTLEVEGGKLIESSVGNRVANTRR